MLPFSAPAQGEMTMYLRLIRNLLAAALITLPMLTLPVAQAQIGLSLSINTGPPALPVYEQPPLPAAGYIWTPGYWAYGEAGYFWVPGVWVQPPSAGAAVDAWLLGL
jgi:hypothetical protein